MNLVKIFKATLPSKVKISLAVIVDPEKITLHFHSRNEFGGGTITLPNFNGVPSGEYLMDTTKIHAALKGSVENAEFKGNGLLVTRKGGVKSTVAFAPGPAFTLPVMNYDHATSLTLNRDLMDHLGFLGDAVSDDEARPNLMQIALVRGKQLSSFGEGAWLASTDGHRLHVVRLPYDTCPTDAQYTILCDTLDVLSAVPLGSTLEVTPTANRIFWTDSLISNQEYSIEYRFDVQSFPRFFQLMPELLPAKKVDLLNDPDVIFEQAWPAKESAKVVKSIGELCGRTPTVSFKTEGGKILISTVDDEGNRHEAEFLNIGSHIPIVGVNFKYLLEMLRAAPTVYTRIFPDMASNGSKASIEPIVFSDSPNPRTAIRLGLVMPMRL
jgi:hypothetical protein